MLSNDEFFLCENLEVKVSYANLTAEDSGEYKVILNILSHYPEKDRFVKYYEIWVSEEYLEDFGHYSPTIEGAVSFSLEYIKKRFEESGKVVPSENGSRCRDGKCTYGDPACFHVIFSHKDDSSSRNTTRSES